MPTTGTRTRTAPAVRQPRAPKPPKPMSATKRNTLATQQLQSTLGPNKTAAVTAALEATNEWLALDAAFQQRLRQKYDELAALGPTSTKAAKDLGPVPVPIKGRGFESYSPYAKYDPYQLVEDYGRHQLRAVLVRATPQHLKEAVEIVHEHEPATKLPNRGRPADMIAYIMEHVAGPGY